MNEQQESDFEYVGFWARVGASLIDTLFMMLILIPVIFFVFSSINLDNYLYSDSDALGDANIILNLCYFVVIITFWIFKSATPGKMAFKAIIVDAKTGLKPSVLQYIVRCIGYIVSTIPFCLGLLWVGWDSKKQGWHDKMARTVVICPKNHGPEKVKFNR